MENTSELYGRLLSLTVYRSLLNAPVISRLAALLSAEAEGDFPRLCTARGELAGYLAETGGYSSLPAAVLEELRTADCVLTRRLAAGDECDNALLSLAARDLGILYRTACAVAAADTAVCGEDFPEIGTALPPPPFDKPWELCLPLFADFHRKNGAGVFVKHRAFVWESGRAVPVEFPDPVRLTDLKEYEYQRAIAVDNTLAFLRGGVSGGNGGNNILLYGDRGTGKSSTVKALLNEYADAGLRMIEISGENLAELPRLTAYLGGIPMKFIIFIDDLSFSGCGGTTSALKAALEGGLASRPDNVLIYVTSNRRHLIRESFSDRAGDEVHHADTVQEAVSLSDRFGICISFLLPDKERFLSIAEQAAADRGLSIPPQLLRAEAEKWAQERGGRSPRFVRQFLDSIALKGIE